MRTKLSVVAKVAVFIASAYVGRENFTAFFYEQPARYWYVGPLFGLVVLLWHATSIREFFNLRSGIFLIAATLVAGLVWYLSVLSLFVPVGFVPGRGSVLGFAAVALGTILLPVAQGWLLKTPWQRVRIAIPSILIGWIFIFIPLQFLESHWHLDVSQTLFAPFTNETYIWQAVYLLFMFGQPPRTARLKKLVKLIGIIASLTFVAYLCVGVFSVQQYASFGEPVSLVGRHASVFESLEQAVARQEGVTEVHGWRVKRVKGTYTPHTFVVSWTCSTKAGKEIGWWWEVNTRSRDARPVKWDKELERKHGLLASGETLPSGWQLLTRQVSIIDVSRVDADSLTIRSRGENGLEGSIVIPRSARVLKQGQDAAFVVEDFEPGVIAKITYTYNPFHVTHTAIQVEFINQ